MKRLTIFADFCDSKNKARGRLYQRQLLKFQMVLYGLLVFQLPLISPLCGQLPPKGKPLKEALIYNFKRFVAVRYETGNARPRGEGYIKGNYSNILTICNSPLREKQAGGV